MKKQFHTPEGVIERDLTLEELEWERNKVVQTPGIKELIKILGSKFPGFLEAVKKELA